MKRIALAAALLACTSLPFAQSTPPAAPVVEVPKYKCEPRPVFPSGAGVLAADNKRKQFDRDLESYKKCMMAYIDQRKAMHEANLALHKAAIEEYNTTMKEVNTALEAAR